MADPPPAPLDVHLLFPPPWSAFHSVHLSLPLLAGHLRRAGLRAGTTDLNIRVTGRLLRSEAVREAAAALERELAGPGRAALSEEAIDAKETALAAAPFVIETVDGAVALLRRGDADEIHEVTRAAQVLRLASM